MLTSSARAPLIKDRNEYIARARTVRPSTGRLIKERKLDNCPLTLYLEGWAEVNSAKILTATAPGYRFCDPLVGIFFRRTVHEYFDLLQDRLSSGGAVEEADLTIFLHGPMDIPSRADELQFWREAPRLGLTGISKITVGPRGVIADSVAYDVNLASDLLRRRAFE
jgi:hypothetical protein